MKLYRWGTTWRPHYVVAKSYAEAESLIAEKYGHFHKIERIELVSEYVLLPAEPTR